MQKQQPNNYWLYLGLFLVAYACYQKYSKFPNVPNIPSIVMPVPILNNNIFYDEYEKCKELSRTHNKKIVLIFGADWCPYCRDLKKDVKNITEFNSYIVCFINTDKNKELVEKYRIRGLPTSVIIDYEEQELNRKSGYKKDSYNEWLKNSKQDAIMSWIDLKK